ncbi:5-deoxy-glucuronate isomerase [Spiroplasma eriocheiris]|uniref:5-deoxy-glucuronate isomerase n=1 Tax=Spiroplasma eriocheiris TaxID=315358 RepID=UPI0011DD1957|nr:5-deoxy-glucuronate isomerase [Spiroplasma eriocheiris]
MCSGTSRLSNKKITKQDIKQKFVGNPQQGNTRIINQLIHPDYVQTNQVCMGITELIENGNWNTMPCHTHERRMEAYLYFDLPVTDIVVHLMGQSQETRSLIVKNNEVVLSPPWSIHCGVGTTSYSFVWGMAGEDFNWDDMQIVKPTDLL